MRLSQKLRVIEVLVAAGAFVVLTGAKGEGCAPSETAEVPEESTEPVATCEPGFHLESICTFEECEGNDPDACKEPSCEDGCVPDSACPPDMMERVACAEPPSPPPLGEPMPPCEGEDCEPMPPPPPPPEDCWLECVPIEPCPPGMRGELVCAEPPPPPPPGEPIPPCEGEGCEPMPPRPEDPAFPCEGEGCTPMPPPPPEPCWMQCVPIEPCPPGMRGELVCAEPPPPPRPEDPAFPCEGEDCEPMPPPLPEECWLECLPIEPCPPGTGERLVCVEPPPPPLGEPMPPCEGEDCEPMPPPPPEACWLECLPIEPCPPGTFEQHVCLPEGGDPSTEAPCWLECIPELVCAPGEHPEPLCTEGPAGEPFCEPVCVPDEVLVIPPTD